MWRRIFVFCITISSLPFILFLCMHIFLLYSFPLHACFLLNFSFHYLQLNSFCLYPMYLYFIYFLLHCLPTSVSSFGEPTVFHSLLHAPFLFLNIFLQIVDIYLILNFILFNLLFQIWSISFWYLAFHSSSTTSSFDVTPFFPVPFQYSLRLQSPQLCHLADFFAFWSIGHSCM